MGRGAIRKVGRGGTRGETAAGPGLTKQGDSQGREEQGRVGDERSMEMGDTFGVLQEEEGELVPGEDSTPIVGADRNENGTAAGKGRGGV